MSRYSLTSKAKQVLCIFTLFLTWDMEQSVKVTSLCRSDICHFYVDVLHGFLQTYLWLWLREPQYMLIFAILQEWKVHWAIKYSMHTEAVISLKNSLSLSHGWHWLWLLHYFVLLCENGTESSLSLSFSLHMPPPSYTVILCVPVH